MGKPGLYQIGKGRKPKRRTRHTLADLAEAASTRKKSNRAGPIENLTNAGNPSYLWGAPVPKGRQCSFTHARGPKAGKGCGSWALRGARYCWHHGGLLDNPDHPSAPNHIAAIEAAQARVAANKELRTHERKTVEIIRQTIRQATGSATAPAGDTLEGVKAYTQDDNGRAYRRWLDHLTSPTNQQRSRKPIRKRASD